jgi:hypothetical protein
MVFTIANYISVPFILMALMKFLAVGNNRDNDLTDEGKTKEEVKKGAVSKGVE